MRVTTATALAGKSMVRAAVSSTTFKPSRSTPEAMDAGPKRLIWMSTAQSYPGRAGYAVGFWDLVSLRPAR